VVESEALSAETIAAFDAFDSQFRILTGFTPFPWQRRLFREHLMMGEVPASLDLPTGLGKTSVMAIWLIARAHGARLPRRLVYVVDRRAVVDQATDEAEKLRKALEGKAQHFDALDESTWAQAKQTTVELKKRLGFNDRRKLPISTLRGAHVDNREWLDDPTAPAIIVGTVDMIGSRLLFEGYGVSRKMRPYQAGLLGVDALIVLDEAHLVPPFAHLLRAIEEDRTKKEESTLWPKDEADRALLPWFVLLPLSATQRDPGEDSGKHEHQRKPFRLEDDDWKTDCVTKRRLEAKKQLHLIPLAEKDQDKQLADAAWALARKDGKFFRVAVFCDRRDKQDDSGGPSAQGVKEAIEKLAKGDRKAGRAEVAIHSIEMLVGARRVHEREEVAKCLRALGFIGEKKPLEKPAFLVATSAGEVGVDIDADHMVSDLAAWERMVQRLGRVNRRGEGDAEIKVFWREPSVKDTKAPTESEKRTLTAFASRTVIDKLPQIGGALDASPSALLQLAESARTDAALKACIKKATTREPLRPALNRALADAWSMTSLETHTGRPDVAPWLRGWVDETPQTAIVWRTHLPVHVDAGGRTIVPGKGDIEDFFEAAPPHGSEKLETETYRVIAWLQECGSELLKRKRRSPEASVADEVTDPEESAVPDAGEPETEQTTPQTRVIKHDDVVALLLSSSGAYVNRYTLGDLAQERKGKAKDEFPGELVGKTLVVDGRFGGLKDGMLNSARIADPFETADDTEKWSNEAQFRVRRVHSYGEAQQDGWRFEDDFVLRRDAEGTPLEWLIVEHFRDAAQKEDARSISKPQELSAHQNWARSEMLRIATAVGLSSTAAHALAVGAGLHDEGKKASNWQRAFKAPRDAAKFGLAGPLAKTRGPIDQAILGGYRHEFGSLPYVEENDDFKELPDDWRELVLHLVAAHHGQARPVIETRGCQGGPPSLFEERARDVALRFARLQKRWGPWGLAWWEALLRAADHQASRDNGAGQAPSATVSA
jgi:CRISPR-associated endonuclease/helicase Cas3